MALGIVDGFFIGSAVGQFPEDTGRMPLFVFFFFDGFYPEVGYAHSHAVVEADTSVFDFGSETRIPLISSAMVMA